MTAVLLEKKQSGLLVLKTIRYKVHVYLSTLKLHDWLAIDTVILYTTFVMFFFLSL